MKTIVLFLSGIITIAFAQNPVHNNNGYVDNMLHVKFIDDTVIEITNGTIPLSSYMSIDFTTFFSTQGYWTRVHKISREELTRLRKNTEKNLGKKIPDPNTEFYFHLYDAHQLTFAKSLLKMVNGVEKVTQVPIPFNTVAPNYQPQEHYISSTTSGIEAELFWTTYNNRGAGIKVCDIEYGFNANHIDLPIVTVVGGTPQDPFGGTSVDHGTAVLGEIASINDSVGTVGIAADCELFFAGAYVDSTYDLSAAITNAISVLNAGDVILLEQQIVGPQYSGVGQFGLVPVEWYEPYFNAIQLAIGQDIIVVEAAGNGEQDLDHPDYSNGNDGHFPFLFGNESGAIIVGAGAVSDSIGGGDVARSRLWFSNYGYAVDVQGNGQAVTTTGYGGLFSADGPNANYTATFGGTSSASPIVTGAVVLLQSLYKDTTGNIITPAQMLELLQLTGKPQQSGTYDASMIIGPLPNVMKAFFQLFVSAGMDENMDDQLLLYPNPGNGNISLYQMNNIIDINQITITNSLGALIDFEIQHLDDNHFHLQINNGSGVYFLKGNTKGKSFTKKIIVVE